MHLTSNGRDPSFGEIIERGFAGGRDVGGNPELSQSCPGELSHCVGVERRINTCWLDSCCNYSSACAAIPPPKLIATSNKSSNIEEKS